MKRMSYLFLLAIVLVMLPVALAQKVSTDFDKATILQVIRPMPGRRGHGKEPAVRRANHFGN